MPSLIHTLETASGAAKDTLYEVSRTFGFVPNMLGIMAGPPAVLEAYQAAGALFDKTSLSATERQIVMLTTSAENGCEYCVSVHMALSAMQKVPDDVIQAIRENGPITDTRLEALRCFTAEVVTTRGNPSEASLAAIGRAGYHEAQVLEIMARRRSEEHCELHQPHCQDAPLDSAFAAVAWTAA